MQESASLITVESIAKMPRSLNRERNPLTRFGGMKPGDISPRCRTVSQYTISFDVNGGEGEFDSVMLDYGSEYGELPVPVNGAWDFLICHCLYGW